jgi:hypothetical protein
MWHNARVGWVYLGRFVAFSKCNGAVLLQGKQTVFKQINLVNNLNYARIFTIYCINELEYIPLQKQNVTQN